MNLSLSFDTANGSASTNITAHDGELERLLETTICAIYGLHPPGSLEFLTAVKRHVASDGLTVSTAASRLADMYGARSVLASGAAAHYLAALPSALVHLHYALVAGCLARAYVSDTRFRPAILTLISQAKKHLAQVEAIACPSVERRGGARHQSWSERDELAFEATYRDWLPIFRRLVSEDNLSTPPASADEQDKRFFRAVVRRGRKKKPEHMALSFAMLKVGLRKPTDPKWISVETLRKHLPTYAKRV
jgi:hypothetical protein